MARKKWSSRTRLRFSLATLAAICLASLSWTTKAFAETTLTLDENAPGEIDPGKGAGRAVSAILFFNLYDPLLLPQSGGTSFAPGLAESWTQDGNSYTFKLRPGVKFHSGNPVTADDVVFSLHRLIALGQGNASLFRGWVKQVDALDPATVRFTLTAPYAPFLATTLRLGILDKKEVMAHLQDGSFGEFKDYGQAWLNQHDAGSGAYRIISHNPQVEAVMGKNPDYYLPIPAAAPDRVIMKFALEAATELALMRRGELDIMSQWASPETKRAAARIPGVTMVSERGISEFFIKMNTRRPPLDDVFCRRALADSLDYNALIGQANVTPQAAGAEPARGPLLPGMLGYDGSVPPASRDMAKATAELAQCKYKAGDIPIDIAWIGEVPLEERFALLMQQNWGELGFKSNIVRVPAVSYYQLITKPETTPNVSQFFYTATVPDSDSFLYNIYSSHSAGSASAAEWLSDPEVDSLLDQGRSTLDQTERAAIYKKVFDRIRDLQPSIFGYQVVITYAKSDRVSVPALQDPAKNTRVMGMNLMFRAMEMK
jgi:peptide/nickel transport system substrate-binding protein